MSNLICQSGYLCFLCQQKLSQSSDISIQSRKYKIVDEEPLRRLCSDQYIFILFVYLLIMIGVWREVIYTRWLISVFLMTFFIYSSIMAQGGIIYWTHTRLHSLGPLDCWLHNNLNKNLALTLLAPISPNWSLYISLKNVLREFDKRSKNFLLDDHFINSHNLISWQSMDIVRRKLMFVTIGT